MLNWLEGIAYCLLCYTTRVSYDLLPSLCLINEVEHEGGFGLPSLLWCSGLS